MNISKSLVFRVKYRNFKTINSFRCCCENASFKLCPPPDANTDNLPLLPIPKIENTMYKLLKSSEPFVSPCELAVFQKLCGTFMKCDGPKLQQHLIERARSTHNWLVEWYRNCAHLCNRDPLPLSSSSVITFPHQKFLTNCDRLDYVAKLILGALKFRYLGKYNRLPLESRGRYVLDMSGYKRIFANVRQPRKSCDELVHHHNSKHIIVMVKNNIFSLKVLTDSEEPLSYNQLMMRLEEIIELGETPSEPFGLLTSLKRNEWTEINEHLRLSPENKCYLSAIESSLFIVCMDEKSNLETSTHNAHVLNACLHGFHGHGPCINGGNRWYDKTLQFFITKDGCSGIIFEQSPVDAVPLTKMADYIVNYIRSRTWMDVPFVNMCEIPQRLSFVSSGIIKCGIKEASQLMKEKKSNFSCLVCNYDRYGKEFCKNHKMSMDAVIQIALQCAYKMTHETFCPQAEEATTRRFFLGRNDLIRSCTCEVIRFIKSYNDPSLFVIDKLDILMDAIKRHRQLVEDVMEGKGIDCHLFGLLMAAKEIGLCAPRFFQSGAFLKSSTFRIVSRQGAMERNCMMGYPLGYSCTGYGVCYNPRAKDINVCVTCRGDDCGGKAEKFLENWKSSMKIISDIICSVEKKKKIIC